jgi:hypothetical protein
MAPTPESVSLPGVVRQVGYVVTDIDEAVATWLSIGVGPWYVLRGQVQSVLYRGEPCTVAVSIAFSNTGDLQLELIQQEGDTPSIYTEFIQSSGGGGFNQLTWWADDFDAALKTVQDAGWPIVWSGGDKSSTRYMYVEPPGRLAPIFEIMESTPGTEGMAKLVREAAAGWDGSDPVRSLG